jgi:hypothetical protein
VIECAGFDLFDLFAEFLVDDFVHFAKGLAQFGVEVVFDAVVATK